MRLVGFGLCKAQCFCAQLRSDFLRFGLLGPSLGLCALILDPLTLALGSFPRDARLFLCAALCGLLGFAGGGFLAFLDGALGFGCA